MLVKIDDILVPHDIDLTLLEFIKEHSGKQRFNIWGEIEGAIFYDKAWIETDTAASWRQPKGSIRIHSQEHSRWYSLYMYAWNHVFAIVPSQVKVKAPVWFAPQAEQIIDKHAPSYGMGNIADRFERYKNA